MQMYSLIGDHDAPYVFVNVQITRFQACYKYIWIECGFDRETFICDFEELPLGIIYSTENPNLQVSYMNTLITDCLNKHVPLKHVRVTRPPAPWMKELDIKSLQHECQIYALQPITTTLNRLWVFFKVYEIDLKLS